MCSVCACYLPQLLQSEEVGHVGVLEYFDILGCQILQHQDGGDLIICGDFNAKIGNLNNDPDNTTNLPSYYNAQDLCLFVCVFVSYTNLHRWKDWLENVHVSSGTGGPCS